jgi:hypothetical protein
MTEEKTKLVPCTHCGMWATETEFSEEAIGVHCDVCEKVYAKLKSLAEYWLSKGLEFFSVGADGLPRPWDAEPIKDIMAAAQRERLEVLDLRNNDHLIAAIVPVVAGLRAGLKQDAPPESDAALELAREFSPLAVKGGRA